MKTKIYRIGVTMIEEGYVEVEAKNEKEAKELAGEACNRGGFIGDDSYARIEEVLEIRDTSCK